MRSVICLIFILSAGQPALATNKGDLIRDGLVALAKTAKKATSSLDDLRGELSRAGVDTKSLSKSNLQELAQFNNSNFVLDYLPQGKRFSASVFEKAKVVLFFKNFDLTNPQHIKAFLKNIETSRDMRKSFRGFINALNRSSRATHVSPSDVKAALLTAKDVDHWYSNGTINILLDESVDIKSIKRHLVAESKYLRVTVQNALHIGSVNLSDLSKYSAAGILNWFRAAKILKDPDVFFDSLIYMLKSHSETEKVRGLREALVAAARESDEFANTLRRAMRRNQ